MWFTLFLVTNIADFYSQSLADSEPKTIDKQKEDAIAQFADGIDDLSCFLAGWNVWDAVGVWRSNDLDPLHVSIEDVTMEELQGT